MRNKIKGADIKDQYFFNNITNNFFFDANNIKIDGKSYKNMFIYYIGCVLIKDLKYVKTSSVNPLYFIFNKVNGYFKVKKLMEINIHC